MKITIFGAGAFGTALGTILEENGHQITSAPAKVSFPMPRLNLGAIIFQYFPAALSLMI